MDRAGHFRLFALTAFLVAYGVLGLLWRIPPFVAGLYLVASFVTFSLYAFDKAAARRGARRISERTLIFFALACGWPGALLAMQFLRHKTLKVPFLAQFWSATILNVIAFVYCVSPASGIRGTIPESSPTQENSPTHGIKVIPAARSTR